MRFLDLELRIYPLKSAKTLKIKDGDILICARNGSRNLIGKNALITKVDEGNTFGAFMSIFRAKKSKYLYHLFQSQLFKKEIRRDLGPTINQVTTGNLHSFKFYFPPLPEQNRIVAVLEAWNKAIEKLTNKIKIKKEIKKGLMQELLTGKTRLPGFSDMWESVAFGDVATLRKERFDSRKDRAQKICVELEHIQSESGRLLGNAYVDEGSSLKSIFYSGDVLFGKLRAYLRKYWFATCDGVCSTEIWVLKANKNVIPNILFQIVQSGRFIAVTTISQGTHMPRSNWGIVADYEVRLPAINEQKAIARILIVADREIAELEQKLVLLTNQKKYLLNNLITGAIRTPKNMRIQI